MKHIIILLVWMGWLGTGLAQRKDSTIRDTGSKTSTLPAKSPSNPGATAVKRDSNRLKKKTDSIKKDTGRRPVTQTISRPDSNNRQLVTKRNTDTSVAAGSGNGSNNQRNNTTTGSAGESTEAAVTIQVPAEKANPLIPKMAASAIAKGTAQLDLATYFPENMNGSLSGDQSLGIVQLHSQQNKDYLFYSFLGITLLLALTKITFPNYFNQIFWFFLHPNDRKKNLSEQMNGQNIIPAFLLNLFFALTGGLFLTQIFNPIWTGGNFWKNWIIFSMVLMVIYLVKFLIIKFSGWLFNSPVAAGTYNNVVFSINKVIGLILLPVTLLIAYGGTGSTRTAISIATILISILLIYRYIASFLLIKGKLRVNAFHFILYLCAVEIIPLLLAYKVLFSNIDQLI